MSVVYVVQDVKRVSYKTGQLESKFNYTRAERFGRLVFIVEGQVRLASRYSVSETVARVREIVGRITPDDHLLLVGDPVVIGIACSVATETLSGQLRLLQWDRRRFDYDSVDVDVTGSSGFNRTMFGRTTT